MDNIEKLHLIGDILLKIAPQAKVVIKVNRFKERDQLQKEFPNYDIVVGEEQMADGMVKAMLQCKI